ncbi:MAG: hypothetical protein HKN34_06705 [Gammaproteobacteria bacterium]|nr:hypothetical protein [Gammaproteobacteria bacterium]
MIWKEVALGGNSSHEFEQQIDSDAYIDCTRRILSKRGGLWFQNESYTITRQ